MTLTHTHTVDMLGAFQILGFEGIVLVWMIMSIEISRHGDDAGTKGIQAKTVVQNFLSDSEPI